MWTVKKRTSDKAQFDLLPLEEVAQCSLHTFYKSRLHNHGLHTVQLRTKILAAPQTPKVVSYTQSANRCYRGHWL